MRNKSDAIRLMGHVRACHKNLAKALNEHNLDDARKLHHPQNERYEEMNEYLNVIPQPKFRNLSDATQTLAGIRDTHKRLGNALGDDSLEGAMRLMNEQQMRFNRLEEILGYQSEE